MENFEIRDLKSPLFDGVSADELNSMIHCLNPQRRNFAKGERIYDYGQVDADIGLVRSGRFTWSRRISGATAVSWPKSGPAKCSVRPMRPHRGFPLRWLLLLSNHLKLSFLGCSRF